MMRLSLFVLSFAVLSTQVDAQQQQNQQPAQTPAVQGTVQKGTTVQGQIVRMEAPDQFVVRTKDNKEVLLYANPQTRYTINSKAGRYSDLRVGTNVNAVYGVRDKRNYVNVVTVGQVSATPPAVVEQPAQTQATMVEGQVVRVIGKDQVVIKTLDNKEVIVYIAPQTRYIINEQPAQFTDFTTGYPVRIEYDVRDRRNVARGIIGRRR